MGDVGGRPRRARGRRAPGRALRGRAVRGGRGAGLRQAPILETERLLLRSLTLGDLDDLSTIYADPGVRAFFPEGPLSREETREEIEWFTDVYEARYGYGLWATIDRASGALIGRCGLIPWRVLDAGPDALVLDHADEHPQTGVTYEVEVAYLLARASWGRGLGTEVARALVAYAFERLEVPRLICLVDPGNEASRRVAEKAGFGVDGTADIEGDVFPLYTRPRSAREPAEQG
jgi:[ribosomal protein S5]-alanine N-acetyltransferase